MVDRELAKTWEDIRAWWIVYVQLERGWLGPAIEHRYGGVRIVRVFPAYTIDADTISQQARDDDGRPLVGSLMHSRQWRVLPALLVAQDVTIDCVPQSTIELGTWNKSDLEPFWEQVVKQGVDLHRRLKARRDGVEIVEAPSLILPRH